MIKVINPENGAPIKDRYTFGGKILELNIPVGKSMLLEEEVAAYLIERFGFLEKGTEVTGLKEEGMIYCKNDCGYANKLKIATIQHEKTCEQPMQARELAPAEAAESPIWGPSTGMDSDGVEWYGGGLQEDRNPMSRSGHQGQPGVFGA